MTRQTLLAIATVSCLVLVRAHAQAPQQPSPAPAATFQVEVNYIDVDVVVTDEKGNFVPGLTIDDFELFEDGDRRTIEAFSHVDIPLAGSERFPGVERMVAPDVRSNLQPVGGRIYAIVLDDLGVSPLRTTEAKLAARQFVEQHFQAGDIAAVVHTSGRAGASGASDASQEFTSDPQLLLAAIDKFMGRRLRSQELEKVEEFYREQIARGLGLDTMPKNVASGGRIAVDPGDFERGQRALAVLDTMRNLAEFLSGVPGRRKALIMFSEGVDYVEQDPFGMRSGHDVLRATQDAIAAAARANVNFYTIDPRGLPGASDVVGMRGSGLPQSATPVALMDELRTSQDSLRTLAEQTGGFAALTTNSFASAFAHIVDRNSRYYVLGYDPPDHPRDGRFHTIAVRTTRPGLRVVARSGYASPRGSVEEERQRREATRLFREAQRPDDTTSAELREVLAAPLPQQGLGLSVHAAPFRTPGKDASVALAIEIEGEALPPAPSADNAAGAGTLELSLFGINASGQTSTGTRTELDLTGMPSETYARVKARGVRFNPRITLAPGRYQLRIGARESAGGATGSVYYDLIVPDFHSESLAMSGLLVTSASAQQTPTAEPDPAVATLSGAATSRREFPVDDTLALYAELYRNNSSQQPPEIDVAVRLVSDSGAEVFLSAGTLANQGQQSERWIINEEIPLPVLEPGRYLLRVEARSGDRDLSTVTRDTLITLTSPESTARTSLDDTTLLVNRAASYVKEFISRFSSVVAEEVYVQQRSGVRIEARDRRELKSDFLFIRPSGADDWRVFRDVREVDGRGVSTRENRLVALLTSPGTNARALDAALGAESAQHFLPRWPVFNNPLLALLFLQDEYRDRFSFSPERSRSEPERVVLRFRERVTPTILAMDAKNVFAEGRLWIDPRTGRVSQTELLIGRNATVTTIFARDEQLKIDVPMEMRERYDSSLYSNATGLAKYSNFRTFQIRTDEAPGEKIRR